MSESTANTVRLAAETLQALRKAKGFRSATVAADFYGWPASRYRSHESGARPILTADAERYSAVYGVPLETLTNPSQRLLTEIADRVHGRAEASRRDTARRLKCARVLAGFESARLAAEAWHWASATYVKHESGDNALGRSALEMYAAAFGVRSEWLQDGSLPSGLSKEIDYWIREAIEDPERFRHMRTMIPPVDPDRISRLKDSLKPGRPSASVRIKEYRWKDLASRRGDLDAIVATNVWNVPPSAVPDGQGAFVLSAEGPGGDRTRWFFVLPGVARDRSDRTYLVVDERGLRIVKGPVKEARAKKILGAIIGTMDSAFDAF